MTADTSQMIADGSQMTADASQMIADTSQITAGDSQMTADSFQMIADDSQMTAGNIQIREFNPLCLHWKITERILSNIYPNTRHFDPEKQQ